MTLIGPRLSSVRSTVQAATGPNGDRYWLQPS